MLKSVWMGSLARAGCRCSGGAGSTSVTKLDIVVLRDGVVMKDRTQNIMRFSILRGSNIGGERGVATVMVVKIDSAGRKVSVKRDIEI